MEGRGEHPLLPPVTHGYLVHWWMEIGPTTQGGMGDAPILWQEIEAWQRAGTIRLKPWEARAIRAMSGEFISQRHDARKPHCPAPYTMSEEQAEVQNRVADQFKAMVAGISGRKP